MEKRKSRVALIGSAFWKMRLALGVLAAIGIAVVVGVVEKQDVPRDAAPAAPVEPASWIPTLAAMAVLLAIGYYLVQRRRSAWDASKGSDFCCTRCGMVGKPRAFDPGNALVAGCLFFMLLIPWIFYSMWRRDRRRLLCAQCGSEAIVPADSPAGRRIIAGA